MHSPITIVAGAVTEITLHTAAAITARYTKALPGEAVQMVCRDGSGPRELTVRPADEGLVAKLQIV
jgi:hypothetical protein